MSIDKNFVKRVGILSRLKIEENNLDAMVAEINKINDWVDQLAKINTDGVEPMNSVLEGVKLPEREDIVTDGNIQDQALSNAPDAMDGFYLVPKVVE